MHREAVVSLIGKSESCFLEMPAMVICSAETVLILLLGALDKIKSFESEFDRNFNGHVGYAGMPFVGSMDHSIMNTAIRICENILSGTAKIEDGGKNAFDGNCKVATDGRIRIVFSPDRLIDEGEIPVR